MEEGGGMKHISSGARRRRMQTIDNINFAYAEKQHARRNHVKEEHARRAQEKQAIATGWGMKDLLTKVK